MYIKAKANLGKFEVKDTRIDSIPYIIGSFLSYLSFSVHTIAKLGNIEAWIDEEINDIYEAKENKFDVVKIEIKIFVKKKYYVNRDIDIFKWAKFFYKILLENKINPEEAKHIIQEVGL